MKTCSTELGWSTRKAGECYRQSFHQQYWTANQQILLNVPAMSGSSLSLQTLTPLKKITCRQIESTVNCDIKSKGPKFSENLLINLKAMQKETPHKLHYYQNYFHLSTSKYCTNIRKHKPRFQLVILTITALPNLIGGRGFTEHFPIQNALQRRKMLSSQQFSAAPILTFSSFPWDLQELHSIIQKHNWRLLDSLNN